MSTRSQPASYTVLAALALCMALQITGLVMILPLFARRFESFGAGVQALGISSMAFALTCTIAAPFIGMLADRFGRRPIILASLLAYALAFSGFLLATTTWMLIVLRGLAGLFTAGLVPAIISAVGDLAPGDRRGQWIGIIGGGASVGWIVGPVLGGELYDRFGYVTPFAASVGMAVLALLLAAFMIPETRTRSTHPNPQHPAWTQELSTLQTRPVFFLLLFISCGVMFAWAFIEPQFMFYAYDDLHWSSSQLGAMMSTYGVACMLGEFTLSRLSDRLGRKPVLVLGLALFSAQFIGMAFFRDAAWIVASFILAGLGNALYDPALSAFLLDITPTEHAAGVMGLKSTAGSVGSLLGPGLVVLVTPFAGPQVIFLVSAALAWVLALSSLFAHRVPSGAELTQPQSKALLQR